MYDNANQELRQSLTGVASELPIFSDSLPRGEGARCVFVPAERLAYGFLFCCCCFSASSMALRNSATAGTLGDFSASLVT
jgi:hypothetical protein